MRTQPQYTPARAVWVRVTLLAGCAAVLAGFMSFKVMDRDFWWHVKAGELILRTAALPATDPFAYTREGLPYLATHEWLAQAALAAVYRIGGIGGVLLWRGAMVFAIAFVLLLRDPRRAAWWSPFVVYALTVARPGLLERPQLFTYLLFAACLAIALRLLDDPSPARLRPAALSFVLLSLLWVNLHGGAALVGAGVVGLLLADVTVGRAFPRCGRPHPPGLLLPLAAVLAAVLATLAAHPSGADTLRYLASLLTDRTIAFIREWQPRPLPELLADHGVLLLFAAGSLLAVRRHIVFCGGLLLAMVVLSRSAVRHETLLAIACCAVTLHQWRSWPALHRTIDGLEMRRIRGAAVAAMVLACVAWQAMVTYDRYAAQEHLYGVGAFNPAVGAADFLEREHVGGRLFNTYGIGGYLLFRGHPVFIDGRNVDYGYDFMLAAFLAGKDPAAWDALERRWGFTVAVVDYNVVREEGNISYARHLDENPAWALVYADDWAAVYVKDVPWHERLIRERRLSIVTPHLLESNLLAAAVPAEGREQLEAELRRVIADNPAGIKARVELAKLSLLRERFDEAEALARAAIAAQPMRPEPYEVLAGSALAQGDARGAAEAILAMLRRAGGNYPDIDYGRVQDILRRGGYPVHAWWYGLRAATAPQTEEGASPGQPATASGRTLDLDFEPEIAAALDEGVAAAGRRDLTGARRAFLRALALDPGRPATLSNLCAVELQAGDLATAREYCERALVRGPELADAHYNLALVLLKQGDREGAQREAELATRHGRDAAGILRTLQTSGR